jgi:hypothetical protein
MVSNRCRECVRMSSAVAALHTCASTCRVEAQMVLQITLGWFGHKQVYQEQDQASHVLQNTMQAGGTLGAFPGWPQHLSRHDN